MARANMGMEPVEQVEKLIVEIRGTRALLDCDLAALYGVDTRTLNQAVRRNARRFPLEFVRRLTKEEEEELRSQIVISKGGRGGRRYAPNAFSEHGALMAATVLNSPRAIEMSVFIVRAFVRLRSIYASQTELARRLDELDARVSEHDVELRSIVEAIRQLAAPSAPKRRPIGFMPGNGTALTGAP